MRAASDGIGKRLRQARRALGRTMDELAEKTKISQSAISLIESGKAQPTAYTVERLAWGLGINACWLAYGIGDKPDFSKKL